MARLLLAALQYIGSNGVSPPPPSLPQRTVLPFQGHGGGGGVTFHGFLCGSGLGRQWWGRVAPTTRRRGLGSGGFVKEVACVLALAQIGW